MRLYKDSLKIFFESKLFFLSTVLIYIGSAMFTLKYYKYPPDVTIITAQLNQGLKSAFYLFVAVMFLSYEYYLKFQRGGIEEASAVTVHGRKNHHLFCAFLTMTLWIAVLAAILTVCVILAYQYYKVRDPQGEYILHIIKNMLINIFLIMELGSLIGLMLTGIKRRILSYALILCIIYLVSPYPERIADAQCVAGNISHSIYPIVELFNIMPLVNSGFPPIAVFGESILFYRLSLILFWMMFAVTMMLLTRKYEIKKILFSAIFTILFFCGYAAPASVVNMNGNPENTMAHDQYYYESSEVTKTKNEKAGYHITSYNMDLKIKRLLSAKVTMNVDESMGQYRMTLYHGYQVKKVSNQDGDSLEYKQNNDYILIKNPENRNVTKICVEYKGYSAAYYSNSQGIYLPGDFAYYPRAGYIPLHNDEGMAMSSCFVQKDTKFQVKLQYSGRAYTNLTERNGVYTGRSDGFTIFAGFYKEKKFGKGNRIIYNYLEDQYYLPGGEIEEVCKDNEKELQKMGKSGVTIFVAPNVNQMRNRDVGEKQVFLRNSPWI